MSCATPLLNPKDERALYLDQYNGTVLNELSYHPDYGALQKQFVWHIAPYETLFRPCEPIAAFRDLLRSGSQGCCYA